MHGIKLRALAGEYRVTGDRESLDSIGRRHGTDKASTHHAYLDTYEAFFAPLRDQPISILEIGVKEGASVRTWREYFPHARIVGFDLNPRTATHASDRVSIEIGDQSDRALLNGLCERYGPFDIVIEDGSHIWTHQILALETIIPHVKPGGYYVMEDIQTSFPPLAERYHGGAPFSAVDYLARLAAIVAHSDARALANSRRGIDQVAQRLRYVCFIRHAAIVRRGS